MLVRFVFSQLVIVSMMLVSPTVHAADADELSRINAIVIACTRLEHDYAIYRDRGNADAFANTFTEDGEWGRSTKVIKGREAIREYIATSHAGEPPEAHMQLTTTVQITPVDDTTATGISYGVVLEAPIPEGGLPATNPGFQVASESRSTYKLTDEGWKIAKREYTTIFVDPE